MIFKLSILAALVAPLVSALTVSQPSQAVTSGGSMTFTWQVQNGDPSSFSVYLSNPQFNNVYGVANNVDASLGTLTITIPLVPENQQYTIRLVQIDNVNAVLAESPSFTIGANTATTTPSSTASPISVSASSRPGSTAAVTTSRTLPSSSSFGVVVSNTQPASTSGASTSPSGAAASSSPSNSAALPVRFNMNMGVVASIVISVVAGAAVAAF